MDEVSAVPPQLWCMCASMGIHTNTHACASSRFEICLDVCSHWCGVLYVGTIPVNVFMHFDIVSCEVHVLYIESCP